MKYLKLKQGKRSNTNYGSFTDNRDNETYGWVKIGDQVWMTENLRFEPDNYIGGQPAWDSLNNKDVAWCWYENQKSNKNTHGVFYTFEAALVACPDGWHLPTIDEWNKLRKYLVKNGFSSDTSVSYTMIGKSLAHKKEWSGVNTHEDDVGFEAKKNNSTGFSGLPSGIRQENGLFQYQDMYAAWWSSSTMDANRAYYVSLSFNTPEIKNELGKKTKGICVRCLMDKD